MAEIELSGPPAEVRFTVTVTRAATGKTETYDMVGHVVPPQQQPENTTHGHDSQHGGAERGD